MVQVKNHGEQPCWWNLSKSYSDFKFSLIVYDILNNQTSFHMRLQKDQRREV